jgi:hypothetical protein
VDSNEVAIHEVERDRIGVIVELLAERVGEPGKAPHVHPHRKVLALHIACRDVLRIRISHYNLAVASDARRRRVSFFGFLRRAVNLLEGSEVHIHAERALYSLQVGFVTVCGDL